MSSVRTQIDPEGDPMNHHDRQTLAVILDQLWEARNGTGTVIGDRIGVFSNRQRELLAAAMRIVAGTEGPELPDPWPGTAGRWTESARAPWPGSSPDPLADLLNAEPEDKLTDPNDTHTRDEHSAAGGGWVAGWRIPPPVPGRRRMICNASPTRPPEIYDLGPWLEAAVLVVDPPYGIDYRSNHGDDGIRTLRRSIANDTDTSVRDHILKAWGDRPALVFGTWRIPRPPSVQMLLIWDTKGANGMGDTSIPWKPSHQEIYVLGHTANSRFRGPRTSDVLSIAPVQSMAKNGRLHPHQKPVALMGELIRKCPPGTVADPTAGSGSTLVAAKAEGRHAIGVELEERDCEKIALRLSQDVLNIGPI
ncbi:MAG: hypothetical protein L6R40_001379 [Gallowayella cf. fulva]|nr:MAG: hypothetical protein L6R40_001379 [Xanthomendoza cf. fulva]